MDSRGQMQIASVAISVIVVFVVLAIGMVIVNNVSNGGNTAAGGVVVPFNGLWPMAIAGVAIIAVVLGLAKAVHA